MSGGSFNYAYRRVETFVEELETKVRHAVSPAEVVEGEDIKERRHVPDFSLSTLARLSEIAKMSEHVAKLMREAEFLYSGDNCEDSFHENLAELAQTMPAAPGTPPPRRKART
jgi:hypothetical protein